MTNWHDTPKPPPPRHSGAQIAIWYVAIAFLLAWRYLQTFIVGDL